MFMKESGLLAIVRICFSSFAITSLTLAVAVITNAQAPGSSHDAAGAGGNTIQGRVYLPAGQSAAGAAFKVRLESVSAFNAPSSATDQDGAFRFSGLVPGVYNIVVEGGKEYETARETVNIDYGTSSRVVSVAIQLRLKAGPANPAFANVPKNAIDLYQKGSAAAQKGNAKNAVDFLSKAVEAYPTFAVALNELGLQYLKLSQWEKAADTFVALLKLSPADSLAQLNLGIALYNQNKLDQAETHLREALKLKSSGPNAHYYLGMTLVKTKRYEEAEKELQLTLSNGGENIALAHKYLGGLYLSGRHHKEAADELETYLRLDPKAADAERIRGTIKELRARQ